jgi:DNA polymerase II large subunit
MVVMSKNMEAYFSELDQKIEEMYSIAREARKKGFDPKLEPETNVASDIAGRVEELVGPKGIAARIRELTAVLVDRDKVAFKVADEIVGTYKDKDPQYAADLAVRCSLAIKTEGVVSAPLEGISEVRIKNDPSGPYLSLYFAGPIRAAGGTTQAYVVLVADHIRKLLGLSRWVPTENEVARYVEEIRLYDRVVNLQYTSQNVELEYIIRNLPVEVTGEMTNKEEVSAHRDIPRIETNAIRGGACLVINDGVLAKSSKMLKICSELGVIDWDWLKTIPKEAHDDKPAQAPLASDKDTKFGDDLFQGEKKVEKVEKKKVIEAKDKFIAEVIAGRPVFAYPSAHGGFRIRYGRSRDMGLAAYGFNPASMYITDNFIAIGTQLRVERPGKSTVAMPVDSIEGPIVLLKNGSVVRVETTKGVEKLNADVEKVLFMGDVLVGFGEFMENNHKALPSPYCEEWWILDLKRALADKNMDVPGLANEVGMDEVALNQLLDDFFYTKPRPDHAVRIAKCLDMPIHPRFIYFWEGISTKELNQLRAWLVANKQVETDESGDVHLRVKNDPAMKALLEKLCIPHAVEKELLDFGEESLPVIETLALDSPDATIDENGFSSIEALNRISGVMLRDKAPYFMGLRMGRPEKARERKMNPPVHFLFPVGHDSNSQRVFQDAMLKKSIEVDIANRVCQSCKTITFFSLCPKCKEPTVEFKTCNKCKKHLPEDADTCPSCGSQAQYYSPRPVNLVNLFNAAVKRLNMTAPKIKAIKGLSSQHKVPEAVEKGILRAKHDVYVYKDGTCRFDTGDCPLTHFTPKEVSVGVDDLKKLGYTHDAKGNPLEDPHQVLELKVQDILLPKAALKYLFRLACFVDDELEKIYGLPRYYNIKAGKDFLGQLVLGLAPHTSAGVVGRIIGFTDANVGFAHPVYHAAKRRNCDGDEDGILLFLDVILNFSRYYLPTSTGAKMDTPLVISSRVVPEEVDAEAHNVDTSWGYPIEFYEGSLAYPEPKELGKYCETIKKRLGKEGQYEGMGFTHPTTNINLGPKTTAYKQLVSMEDKIRAQFSIGRKIASVDVQDEAFRVIQAHFTPDIAGNLRAFATQQFRCTRCNTKYRRPPLGGKCTECGNTGLALTVSPSSIKKYLAIALSLVKEYHLSEYTKQKIEILAERVESTVFNGTRKQTNLGDFFTAT